MRPRSQGIAGRSGVVRALVEDCLKGVGKMAAKRKVVKYKNIRERAAGAVVLADQRPRMRSLVGVEEVLVNLLNIKL